MCLLQEPYVWHNGLTTKFHTQKINKYVFPTSLTYCCVNYMPKDAWQHYYEFLAVYHAHPYP